MEERTSLMLCLGGGRKERVDDQGQEAVAHPHIKRGTQVFRSLDGRALWRCGLSLRRGAVVFLDGRALWSHFTEGLCGLSLQRGAVVSLDGGAIRDTAN